MTACAAVATAVATAVRAVVFDVGAAVADLCSPQEERCEQRKVKLAPAELQA